MKKQPKLVRANKLLALENAKLSAKIALTERSLNNNLGGLASALCGTGGEQMSNLTSFGPSLSNNIYAPYTLMWSSIMYSYKTHGLLQTAIDMPVLDAIRGGIDITSDGQLSADDIVELQTWLEENDVLARIVDSFIWARLFGGGALVINTEGDCEEPLGDEIMDGGKIELYDACRWELSSERRIPASGFYTYYGKKLDKSRVITILGKRAPWLIRAQLADWGMSELERVIEDFNLFLRTRNVLYEILEEAKVDVYSLRGFAAQLASSTGTALTVRRIQAMNQIKNFNNALILDKEDSYDTKQLGFTGISEIMAQNRMGLASAFRMPMTKLFGIPAAAMTSGEDDIENYNGLVESEVRQPMRHVIKKVLKLIIRNIFHDDFDFDFSFKPLRIMSSTEEEAVKSSRANRYNALYSMSLMSSKELGEAYKKDDLVPVPLAAEKGLLDDHPVAVGSEMGPLPGGAAVPIAATPAEKGEDTSAKEPSDGAKDAPGASDDAKETQDGAEKKPKTNRRLNGGNA